MGVASFEPTTVGASPTTFHKHLHCFQKLYPKEVWILDELDLAGGNHHTNVIRSIQNGTACAIIEISFKDRSGAAGFMIICPKNEGTLYGTSY